MGHRCCSRQKVKRGLWSPEEDDKLVTHITSHGHGSWSSVPKLAGLQRCGKSCRLRWINYLRPDLRRGSFTEEEERTIIEVHRILGNRWAQIAKHLPGRTDNEVKNFWNSCIKKKLLAQGLDPNTHNLLPSLHKKSKNNSSHRIPSSVSSSLAFSIDQTSSHHKVISNVTQTNLSAINDVELELQNIQFGCNHPKEPQNHSNSAKSADFTTQCFELNTVKMSNDSCSSFDISLCDMIVDENSLWDAALGNLEQPLSNTTQAFEQQDFSETFDKTGTTRQEEVICDQKFEASFNSSTFDSCFQEGHNSTILANSIYGDIVSVMEQIAWGNC